ncbi:ComEC/Rec2 family competence protein [Antribacter sp. KLBMP9083]|uniref:ComEC/Rec2 family competence protein n=1 Tax=Antribacter soli TaxID=2910976 RepID=A0AA41QGA9_9MICO|nr:ComEC/Rec2 family competence protein [Antribacter soli]MCF4121569.1 ComEC/Rec2 family competence protein [Antribacter soli]
MTDLRLAPAALATWVAAWLVTGPASLRTWPVLLGLGVALVVAAGAVVAASAGRGDLRPAALAHALFASACLLTVVASAHVQLAGRAPLERLAAAGAVVTMTGTVVAQPEPVTTRLPSGGLGAIGPGPEVRWVLAARVVSARGVATPAGGHVQVTSTAVPRYGAFVTVTGRSRPADPGAAEAARVAATRVAQTAPPAGLLRVADTLSTSLLAVTADLSPQGRGLVPGAAIGDTSRLPPDIADALRTTGLTHITAVSGSHFAIVVAVLTGLCATARMPRAARVGVLAVAAAGFVVLVRPEPSVLRAAVMTAFALAGTAIGRPSQAVPALAATAVGLLVVDPWLSRSFGFALSAAATAGLVLLVAPLGRRLEPWIGRVPAFALAVPVAAQAACGPILVLLSPSVSAVTVPANLLAAPALVPATVLGLVATLFAPWAPPVAHAVAWAASGATWWIAQVATWGAALPGASLPWPGGPAGALLLAAVTLSGFWVVLRASPRRGWPDAWRHAARSGLRRAIAARRRSGARARLLALAVVVAVAATAACVAVPRVLRPGPELPGDWQVVACDVGQGDGLVLRTGTRSAVVIDVGPDGDAAGRCLDDLGITRVDLLVLSHFHADHVGGLPAVLSGRQVDVALVSPLAVPDANAAWAVARLEEAGVPVRAASAGETGTAGTARWEVLLAGLDDERPSSGGGEGGEAGGDGANDASVALAVRTADLDVVLLGDLEDAGQEALLAGLLRRGAGAVDVVKVAHHGSRVQSPGLAELLSPAVAIVSSGEGNTYGHPTDIAIGLYEGVGAAVVRTDECGTFALVVREGQIGLAGC